MNPNDIFPLIDPQSSESIEHLKNMTPKERRAFKKSKAYKKYVRPSLEREKKLKNEKRKSWWWSNGLAVINTILALIAAITGIISLLLQLQVI